MQQFSWDEFRLVKAIADTQSLGGAGETLGLNHSTVFRRLNALEEQLGSRLFERSRTGYTLTAGGEEMVALASRMAEEIVNFERKVAGRDIKPSGELRVTTADIALRAAREPPETLVGRRLATLSWAVFASRKLTQSLPSDIEMTQAPWIGLADPIADIAAAKWMASAIPSSQVRVRVNAMSSVLAAIEAGLGYGVLPCFVGDRCPNMVRINQPVLEGASSLWILTHPDLRQSARVRVFLDYAGRELGRMRKLIEGETPVPVTQSIS